MTEFSVEVIRKVLLENTNGNHNKFYEITVREMDEDEDPTYIYEVATRYGSRRRENWRQRGGTTRHISYYIHLDNALGKLEDIVKEKIRKGYRLASKETNEIEEPQEDEPSGRFADLDF